VASRKMGMYLFLVVLVCVAALPATAQSFRVQCPGSTITHPTAANNNADPAYTAPTYTGTRGYPTTPTPTTVNGAIKCQQISGGDGYATMADGTQTFMFSFGPLSGLADIAKGLPGTQFPSDFNTEYLGTLPLQPGDPATSDGVAAGTWPTFPISTAGFTYNGAVGLTPDADAIADGLCTAPCLAGAVDH